MFTTLRNKHGHCSKDHPHLSTAAISFWGVLFFYLWMTLYAVFVFQQFTVFQVLLVSLVFFSILIILTKLLVVYPFISKSYFNICAILPALILSYFMIMLSNAPNPQFLHYFHTFPLLETELALGFHPDSVYHASIIQSILNFGYPSTAQHGTPLTIYHVLSHYIDALIIYITRIEVYDSYGLFYHFKTFLLISAIAIFLGNVIQKVRAIIYLFIFLLVAPALIGAWTAIGSHSLWFTSIVLTLSSIKVYTILTKNKENGLKDTCFLFLLVVILSLGKISTGFACGLITGLYLFFKYPKNYLVYLMGLGWITFLYIYQKHLSFTVKGKQETFLNYMIDIIENHSPLELSIFYTIVITCAIGYLFRTRENFTAIASTIGSSIILFAIIYLKVSSHNASVVYFQYGLFSILSLLMIQSLYHNIYQYSYQHNNNSYRNGVTNRILIFTSIALAIFISSKFYHPDYSIKNMGFKNTRERLSYSKNGPFININTKLQANEQIHIGKNFRHLFVSKFQRPLNNFRIKLFMFMDKQGVSKKNSFLFISKEFFENDLYNFNGPNWASGMMIYAVTGVPLVNAVKALYPTYGFIDYTKGSLFLKKGHFRPHEICINNPSKSIIIVESFKEATFSISHCSDVN